MPAAVQRRVLIPNGVMVRELGQESVLLNLESESYFGLDDVGTRMWNVLTQAPSIQSAYEQLLTEYHVDPAQLRVDLLDLVDRLTEDGLVVVRDD